MPSIHHGLVWLGLLLGLAACLRVGTHTPAGFAPFDTVTIHRCGSGDGLIAPLPQPNVLWAELIPQSGGAAVMLPPAEVGETLLMVSVQDVPRRSSTMTVTIEDASAEAVGQPIWQAMEDHPVQSPFPALPSAKETARINTPEASPAESLHETWFLPTRRKPSIMGSPGAALSTMSVLCDGRVRIVWDREIAWNTVRLDWCRQLAARLNSVLIPRVESVFGPVADRLAAGTLTVVVTPRVRDAGGSGSPVEAFVLASDFRVDLERPESHGCDAIYLHPDLDLGKSDPILVHELTHAAQFCTFRRRYGRTPWPLQDWMLEGCAHAAEVLLTHNDQNVADRLLAFHQAPEQSPLVVVDAAVSGRWRDPRCRGAACSFFTWGAQRYGLEAMARRTVPSQGIDDPWLSIVGQRWPEIHRAWLVSVAIANETQRHPVRSGHPVTIRIDGGATAFFTLPSMAGQSQPLRLSIASQTSAGWHATLVQTPQRLPGGGHQTPSPAGNYFSSGVGFTSPVTMSR